MATKLILNSFCGWLITLEKAPAYLALDNVLCVGGSWIAPNDKIKAGDWAAIEDAAKKAVALKA